MIQKLAKSPYIEDWLGLTITIYATTTKVAGEEVECLRVRPVLPNVKKVDLTTFENKLKACKSLDELRDVFTSAGFPQKELTALKDKLKNELSTN